jgi:ribosomal-protein-alanine N-acetyltransferase
LTDSRIGPGDPLSPNIEIIPATWRDLNGLRQVEQVCFPKDAWPFWDLAAVLTLPDVIRLKAAASDKMIGFISGDIRRRDALGWITTLAVLPEYQKQGIATRLLSLCEQKMNMPRVRLCVRKSNEPAIKLYMKEGYNQAAVWPVYYGDGEDALVLEKIFANKVKGFSDSA